MRSKQLYLQQLTFILSIIAGIFLTSCVAMRSTPNFEEEVDIPGTDFIIQPLEGFRARETEISIFIRQYPPNYSAHNPTFEAYGIRFEDKQSRDDWDNWVEKLFSDPSLGNVNQIEINGVPTTIANYAGDGSEEITLTWVAILVTEDQSMLFHVASFPADTVKTGELFKAMLETTRLK